MQLLYEFSVYQNSVKCNNFDMTFVTFTHQKTTSSAIALNNRRQDGYEISKLVQTNPNVIQPRRRQSNRETLLEPEPKIRIMKPN